jgi:hypothetical protein
MQYTGNHFPRQIVAEIIEGGVTGFIVESIEEAVEAVERIPGSTGEMPRHVRKRFTGSRD